MSGLKVWSEPKKGKDGNEYSVRYLLTDAERIGLQRVGLLGEVNEVVGMQTAADALVAAYECETHTTNGGLIQ